jgi:tRNA(Ile)-lysidine synthase
MNSAESRIISFIDEKKMITSGDSILVALSGGADSVFLLYILNKLKEHYQIKIAAAHVNHCLRGENSDEDEQFCSHLCLQLNIPLESVKINVKEFSNNSKHSTEEAARILRYNALNDICQNIGFNKIATAHHMGDNAETVLLNLFKGSGLKGVSGIPRMRENIIRPIMCISKHEIIEYLSYLNQPFRTDESNNENIFQRNFIRNVLIKQIKETISPAVESNLLRSSEIFSDALELIEEFIAPVYNKCVKISLKSVIIEIGILKHYSPAAAAYIFRKSISEKFNIELSYSEIKNLELLTDKQTGRRIDLSGDLRAYSERGKICILKKEAEEKVKPVFIKTGETCCLAGKTVAISLETEYKSDAKERNSEYISADSLNDEFEIRKWENGDRFCPLGLRGYKKISDFLTDQKIPSLERKNVLVLLNQNKIICVPGYRIDDSVKIVKATKRILKICLK